MEKTTTVKIWVQPHDFKLIQEGAYPREFFMSKPSHLLNAVEMTVSMDTISEWTNKQLNSTKPHKILLKD